MRNARSVLMAATAMSVMAGLSAMADAVPTLRSAGSGNNRRPTPPKMDTAWERECAERNAAIVQRNAEKKAAKRARRLGVA